MFHSITKILAFEEQYFWGSGEKSLTTAVVTIKLTLHNTLAPNSDTGILDSVNPMDYTIFMPDNENSLNTDKSSTTYLNDGDQWKIPYNV